MRSPASRCRRAGSVSLVTSAARVTVRCCSSHSSQNSWRPNFSLGSCIVACEDSGHACQVFPGFAQAQSDFAHAQTMPSLPVNAHALSGNTHSFAHRLCLPQHQSSRSSINAQDMHKLLGPAVAHTTGRGTGRAWNTLRGRSSAADTVPSWANEMKSK